MKRLLLQYMHVYYSPTSAQEYIHLHNYLELNCTVLQDQTGQNLYFLPKVGRGISQ